MKTFAEISVGVLFYALVILAFLILHLAWWPSIKDRYKKVRRCGQKKRSHWQFKHKRKFSRRKTQRFFDKRVGPVILKTIGDKDEIPAIRNRIYSLLWHNDHWNLMHGVAQNYSEQMRTYMSVIDCNVINPNFRWGLAVELWIPAIRDLYEELSKEQFENSIRVIYAHEMIHIEQWWSRFTPIVKLLEKKQIVSKRKKNKYIIVNESDCWAKTVLEVIRPMHEQGRPMANFMVRLNEVFLACNNDWKHPDWRNHVRDNHCTLYN